jgi:hypothetical protein
MSEENAEVIRAFYEAFRRSDSATLADEDIYTMRPNDGAYQRWKFVPR